MAFDNLSRRHAIKIAASAHTSVEECGLAVGQIVGHASVVSASRMNGSVVLFLDSVDKVNEIVSCGVVINDQFLNVLPLVTPAKRITLSNVPPFIKDEVIARELSRFGKLVSSIKKVPLGCKSPLLKHVVSFRRHVFMVLNDYTSELNVTFKFKVDHFDYVIFATTESMKCFGCGKEGHLIRACPEKIESAQDMAGAENGINVNVNVNNGNSGGAAKGNVETNEEQNVNVNGEQSGSASGDVVLGPVGPTEENGEHGDVSEDNVKVTENPAGFEADGHDDAMVSQASVSIASESLQESNGAGDMLNVMMEKIATDLMVKDKNVDERAEQILTESENMDTDDSVFKTPKVKRKQSPTRRSSRAKKYANEPVASNVTTDACMLTDTEDDFSDSSSRLQASGYSGAYTAEMIKIFLVNTKNSRKVKVEEHFPDTKDFVKAVQYFRRLGSFTEPEIHRLRKFVTVLNHQANGSDSETA